VDKRNFIRDNRGKNDWLKEHNVKTEDSIHQFPDFKRQQKAQDKEKRLQQVRRRKDRQQEDGRFGLPDAEMFLHMVPAIANSLKPNTHEQIK